MTNRINISIAELVSFEIVKEKAGAKPVWWQCRICRPAHRRVRAPNVDAALDAADAHLAEKHHATFNSPTLSEKEKPS